MGEVAIVVAGGGDPLVDLEDRRLFPGQAGLGDELDHPPRVLAAAQREVELAALGERPGACVDDELGHPAGGLLGVRDADEVHERALYAFFSSWPPNCFRIADRTLSAKSSRPRDANRE